MASERERDILRAIHLALGSRGDVRLWRQSTGRGLTPRAGLAWMSFGLPGAADLTGILSDGKRLEVEVKTSSGKQSKQQANFQAMIEDWGGVYILARSVDDALSQLRARGYCLIPSAIKS